MTKEEKDKLIALSDLNREDNIKYISSEAQGIAITLDSDSCAPTFCKLERAYICGRRFTEKQIAELEKENANLKSIADFQQSGNMSRYFELKRQGEQLTKAKELIENIIRVTWGEGWNYSLDWKVKAEDFIKE